MTIAIAGIRISHVTCNRAYSNNFSLEVKCLDPNHENEQDDKNREGNTIEKEQKRKENKGEVVQSH